MSHSHPCQCHFSCQCHFVTHVNTACHTYEWVKCQKEVVSWRTSTPWLVTIPFFCSQHLCVCLQLRVCACVCACVCVCTRTCTRGCESGCEWWENFMKVLSNSGLLITWLRVRTLKLLIKSLIRSQPVGWIFFSNPACHKLEKHPKPEVNSKSQGQQTWRQPPGASIVM